MNIRANAHIGSPIERVEDYRFCAARDNSSLIWRAVARCMRLCCAVPSPTV
jgi:hypothetical protein